MPGRQLKDTISTISQTKDKQRKMNAVVASVQRRAYWTKWTSEPKVHGQAHVLVIQHATYSCLQEDRLKASDLLSLSAMWFLR